MKTISAARAPSDRSSGKNAAFVSEEDWEALRETLYLASVPGMAESIREGGETAIEDCVPEEKINF